MAGISKTKVMIVVSKIAHTLDSVTPETAQLVMEFIDSVIDQDDPNGYLNKSMRKVLGK